MQQHRVTRSFLYTGLEIKLVLDHARSLDNYILARHVTRVNSVEDATGFQNETDLRLAPCLS